MSARFIQSGAHARGRDLVIRPRRRLKKASGEEKEF